MVASAEDYKNLTDIISEPLRFIQTFMPIETKARKIQPFRFNEIQSAFAQELVNPGLDNIMAGSFGLQSSSPRIAVLTGAEGGSNAARAGFVRVAASRHVNLFWWASLDSSAGSPG